MEKDGVVQNEEFNEPEEEEVLEEVEKDGII